MSRTVRLVRCNFCYLEAIGIPSIDICETISTSSANLKQRDDSTWLDDGDRADWMYKNGRTGQAGENSGSVS